MVARLFFDGFEPIILSILRWPLASLEVSRELSRSFLGASWQPSESLLPVTLLPFCPSAHLPYCLIA